VLGLDPGDVAGHDRGLDLNRRSQAQERLKGPHPGPAPMWWSPKLGGEVEGANEPPESTPTTNRLAEVMCLERDPRPGERVGVGLSFRALDVWRVGGYDVNGHGSYTLSRASAPARG